MLRGIIRWTAIAAALSVAACVRNVAPAPERDLRVAVDAHNPVLQLPVYVAVRQRMFAAEKVSVTLAEFPDAKAATEAVTSGACQLASGGFDEVLLAGAQGRPLTAFMLLARSPMLTLVASVRKRKRHQSPSNLKGESIAIESAGNGTERFARFATEQDGLEASDVEMTPKGSMAAVESAFEQRETAGAVLDAIAMRGLETRGVPYELLADTRTLSGLLGLYGVSTYPASCIYASSTWLSAGKDQARRFAKAMAAALSYIQGHKADELVAMLPEDYRSKQDATALRAVVEQARPLFSQDGAFTAEAVNAVRKVLAGSIPAFRKTPVAEASYTNEFVPTTRR